MTGQAPAGHLLRELPKPAGRVPTWSSRLVGLLGLVTMACAVFRRRRSLLGGPIALNHTLWTAMGSILGIAGGFGLLIIARGLRHRERAAWRAVVAVLGSMTLACWLLGVLITQADRDALVPGWTWPDLILHVGLGMIGAAGTMRFVSQAAATHNSVLLVGLGVITVVTTLRALLSSSTTAEPATAQDRMRVRALLETHGHTDSLGYFATRDDKSVSFSPSEKSAVAYRVISGVCLASGDPLGDVEAWPAAIESWLRLAHQRAWIPAVLGATETGARSYQRFGLDALEIGDEAIIDAAGFSLDGRAMRTVRQAANRARRAGYSTTLSLISDLPAEHVEALRRTSVGWRPHSGSDRGFSMALSRFGAVEDPDAVIVEGYSQDRQLVAVLQLVTWGTRGWSLDVMHRSPGLDNGVMEMMIADVVEAARGRGIRKISLNFALFRSALARGERIGAGPILRAWVRLLLFASRWWQIASLYRANAKLCPSWKPRFLCFASARDLGDIVFACVQAEGFLTLPWRSQPRRHQAGASLTGASR